MENSLNDSQTLEVSVKLRADLRDAAVWGRLIAIVSFCSSAMSILAGFRSGSFVGPVIAAGISVFIYIYLFKFGASVKKALDTNDQQLLHEGLHGMQTYFKILGVIIIIALLICVLAFVFLMLGALIKL